MAVLYSIRDWDEHFEVAQSRKAKRTHSWVALPTKHDGKSFRRIMLLPDGPEIYGAWVLLVQIAAKCPTRGILADKDGPLDEADFHIKTGAPQTLFSKALNVLSSRHIGWIVGEPWEDSGSVLPPQTNKTVQDKTRQNKPQCAAEAAGVIASPQQIDPPAKAAGPQPSLTLPPALAADPFPAAWLEWLGYRKERRLTLRDRTMRAQLDSLAPLGPVAAAECVRLSIRNGWQGIFPERRNENGTSTGKGSSHVGPGQRYRPAAHP
jgi:hypothetical protein